MAEAPRWGRLRADVRYPLRRGAWYRITEVTSAEVVVEVNRRMLPVPRPLVELADAPPRRWTVVERPADAVRMPEGWGDRYLVCPSCRHRSPLHGRPQSMRCPRCYGLFPIAWDEHYRSEG
jgi:hypothetical protein